MATADEGSEPRYRDEDWLREQYVEEGLTQAEIGELCNVCSETIRHWLSRHSIGDRENKLSETEKEEFWEHVKEGPKQACWLWTGSKSTSGHGQFYASGRMWPAHRIAFTLDAGEQPENCVLHVCDNPQCVNPEHLYDGTYSENLRDAYIRGRRDAGKLSADDVEEIVDLASDNPDLTQSEIAEQYQVTRKSISNILTGRTWSRVTGIEPDD